MKKIPFCKSKSNKVIAKIKANTRGVERNFYVTCLSCRARGPLKNSEQGAINSWNGVYENKDKVLFA